MKDLKKPFIGVNYYPEDWPESEMDGDIAKMREYGITVARIGEFAWYKSEPEEGKYDFEWLHVVVDKLGAAGIRVIMGTPTAVPPKWVTAKDSEMIIKDRDGHNSRSHGGRRHACSNNPVYLEYCDKFVTALAREFGKDENIIGWQIDNEIYIQNCHCKHCKEKFRKYLSDKYGTVEELNRRWNLNLFSSAYGCFDDIDIPGSGWIHPSHMLEYKNFDGDSQIAFVERQAKILKKYTTAPIGTDQMPYNQINYRKMHEPLDVVQFNHYNRTDNLWEAALWMDYFRCFKDTPFWNTETATCWCGGNATPAGINRDGFCYANTWLPVVLGGEANLYWLWRTHWAGHELMHGSVLESCGRPQYNVSEVAQAAKDFEKASDFITSTKVASEVGLHFTALNEKLYATQPMVTGFDYQRELKKHFYKPMIDSGLRPDVIDAAAPLDKYKVVFSPMTAVLDEDGLPERLKNWIENGGVWVTGPMTDIRTEEGTKYRDRYHGMLEELTDAYFKCFVPDTEDTVKCRRTDGGDFAGSWYYECFEPRNGKDGAVISGGSKHLEGLSVLQRHKVGKGSVVVVGTLPDYDSMRRLITEICTSAGVECDRVSGKSVIVSDRVGSDKKGVILADIGGEGGTYRNNKVLCDVLTGKEYSGNIDVEPYKVLVLEEK